MLFFSNLLDCLEVIFKFKKMYALNYQTGQINIRYKAIIYLLLILNWGNNMREKYLRIV